MATKLYLNLYDGHYDPDMGMDDYGFAGPSIGPLEALVVRKKENAYRWCFQILLMPPSLVLMWLHRLFLAMKMAC